MSQTTQTPDNVLVQNIHDFARAAGETDRLLANTIQSTGELAIAAGRAAAEAKALALSMSGSGGSSDGKPWVVYADTAAEVDVATLPDGALIQTEEPVAGAVTSGAVEVEVGDTLSGGTSVVPSSYTVQKAIEAAGAGVPSVETGDTLSGGTDVVPSSYTVQKAIEAAGAGSAPVVGGGVATYYISPEGADTNDGLTASTPVKTFARLHVLLSSSSAVKKFVNVTGGTYDEVATFYPDDKDVTLFLRGSVTLDALECIGDRFTVDVVGMTNNEYPNFEDFSSLTVKKNIKADSRTSWKAAVRGCSLNIYVYTLTVLASKCTDSRDCAIEANSACSLYIRAFEVNITSNFIKEGDTRRSSRQIIKASDYSIIGMKVGDLKITDTDMSLGEPQNKEDLFACSAYSYIRADIDKIIYSAYGDRFIDANNNSHCEISCHNKTCNYFTNFVQVDNWSYVMLESSNRESITVDPGCKFFTADKNSHIVVDIGSGCFKFNIPSTASNWGGTGARCTKRSTIRITSVFGNDTITPECALGSLSKKFEVATGGMIDVGGLGPNFFPGTKAGTIDTATYGLYF